MARITVLSLLLLSGCKPTCPAGNLECLVGSLEIRDITDDVTGPGTKLTLKNVQTSVLIAAQGADNTDGGANASHALNFTGPTELTFETNVDSQVIFFLFNDPLGCRPGVCFTPCPKNARCLGGSRCTGPIGDGLHSGSGFYKVEYASQPAEPADFSYAITPVAAEGCPADIVALLEAGSPVLVGLSDFVDVHLPGPGQVSATGGGSGGGTGTGTGGGTGSGCSITRDQCCVGGASLCGVSPTTCDDCPTGTRKGIICAAGSPCNTSGGISPGSRLCHCQ